MRLPDNMLIKCTERDVIRLGTRVLAIILRNLQRIRPETTIAVRVHRPCSEYPEPAIGDYLRPSWRWERDERTEEELEGTSCVKIDLAGCYDADTLRNQVYNAVAEVLNYVWDLDDVLLVLIGEEIGLGDDIEETLLDWPEVIGKMTISDVIRR
jgi:hypothetical protein